MNFTEKNCDKIQLPPNAQRAIWSIYLLMIFFEKKIKQNKRMNSAHSRTSHSAQFLFFVVSVVLAFLLVYADYLTLFLLHGACNKSAAQNINFRIFLRSLLIR